MVQQVAINIEPLKVEQVDNLVALDRLSLGGMWTKEKYLKELSWANSKLLVLGSLPRITSKNSKQLSTILGFGGIRAIANEVKITILAIHPQYQGQGLGQLLFFELLMDVRNQGFKRVRLEARVSNQAAINLYQQFGFEIIQTIPNYYRQPNEDGLMLYLGGLNKSKFQQQIPHWQQKIISKLGRNGFNITNR